MKRIFLVGCARSGTTITQTLLSTRLPLASFPETHFFVEAVGQDKQRVYGKPAPIVKRLRARLGIVWTRREVARSKIAQLSEKLSQQRLEAGTHFFLQPYVDAYVAILDRYAAQNRRQAWLEKTPNHVYYLDAIRRHIPDAKIIHILRAGEDVVASLVDAARKNPRDSAEFGHDFDTDVDACVDRWNAAVRVHRAAQGRPDHFFLRYETLVEQTETTLQALAGFLGFDAAAILPSGEAGSASALVHGGEHWKSAARSALVKAQPSKFGAVFSQAEQRHIRERLLPAPF